MGKRAKTSRKGKKEWRANISTEDTENYFIKQGLEERTGGALDAKPDDSLFFVDKSKDVALEKKTKQNRSKALRVDTILQRNPLIPTLKPALKRKSRPKDRDVAKPLRKAKPSPVGMQVDAEDKQKFQDIWGIEGETLDNANRGFEKLAARKRLRVEAPAVEVDAPGCSYNPSYDNHQEVLGLAVAQEMEKIYKKELEPEPIPRVVPGNSVDEEDMFFIEADDGEEDAIEAEGLEEDDVASSSRAVQVKKLTRPELNRRARKRENVRLETEKKKFLKVKKDVLRLPEIMEDIAAEDLEKKERRIRRKIGREERRARGPPRLSKHRFKPEAPQVLLSEEVTGSLRKLKPCFTLLRDRYKSLQRRGIVEPRVAVRRKEAKRRVMYEPGTKGQKEREMHAAMEAEREARKTALVVIPVK